MRQDIRIIKHYRYPLLVNQSALIKRLRHWEELSLRLDSIPAFSLVKEEIVPSGHNPEDYIVERLSCDSHDGKKIPLTIKIKDKTENGH